jgi:hypothetical protein
MKRREVLGSLSRDKPPRTIHSLSTDALCNIADFLTARERARLMGTTCAIRESLMSPSAWCTTIYFEKCHRNQTITPESLGIKSLSNIEIFHPCRNKGWIKLFLERPISRKLTQISMSRYEALTDVQRISEQCLQLSSVDYRCYELTDASVEALAQRCPQLRSADFYKCDKLTDVSVQALAQHCPQLRSVNFDGCDMLTDVSVQALAQHCPQLRGVNFGNCDKLTDASVCALAEHCPQLRSVHFGLCDKLTDVSVVALAEHCPQLRRVTFCFCDKLTDVSVCALAKHCPQLRIVDFQGCDNMADIHRCICIAFNEVFDT